MRKSTEFRRGRTCVYDLKVHLVFVTKYRRGVFKAEHLIRLREIFASVCSDFGAALLEMNGEDDHVHLLVSYPPKVSVSSLVNSLKGVSSRLMRKEFPELRSFCFRNALWSPSYFAASCGGAPLSVLKQYIQDQRKPD